MDAWSWRYSWSCPERLCWGAHRHFYGHLQCLVEPSCCPCCWCLKATTIILVPKKPSPSCINDDRPVASHAPHQVYPPPRTGLQPNCISVQRCNQRCNLHCPLLNPHSHGEERPAHQNAVHWLQWGIQHNHSPAAHPQTSLAGLSDGESTGSSGPASSR